MNRRKFSREFKIEAIKLVREQKQSIAKVARDLDLSDGLLNKWIRLYEADKKGAFPGEGTPQAPGNDGRILALQKELKRVQMERDILKKAMAYFVESPK